MCTEESTTKRYIWRKLKKHLSHNQGTALTWNQRVINMYHQHRVLLNNNQTGLAWGSPFSSVMWKSHLPLNTSFGTQATVLQVPISSVCKYISWTSCSTTHWRVSNYWPQNKFGRKKWKVEKKQNRDIEEKFRYKYRSISSCSEKDLLYPTLSTLCVCVWMCDPGSRCRGPTWPGYCPPIQPSTELGLTNSSAPLVQDLSSCRKPFPPEL